MATRAKISIKDLPGIALYKHWDGYPEGTLPWLESFNKRFTEERGNDLEYKMAQLIRSSAFDCEEFNLDPSRATGWGVIKPSEWDTDFEYVLLEDGTVEVKSNY